MRDQMNDVLRQEHRNARARAIGVWTDGCEIHTFSLSVTLLTSGNFGG